MLQTSFLQQKVSLCSSPSMMERAGVDSIVGVALDSVPAAHERPS